MQNECFVCGSNDYTIIDGVFVCNECGIQSQTIREEQVNFTDNTMNVIRNDLEVNDHELTTGSQLTKVTKLLSWECFNLILLGLTKEIIELGAKPCLKVTVLQLWVRYLQSIEAAFISKKSKKLPKLNSLLYNVDGEILYGIKNIKKKLIHSKTRIRSGRKKKIRKRKPTKSNDSHSVLSYSSTTASKQRRTVNIRLRQLDMSARDSTKDSVKLADDISLLQRNKKSSKVRVKITKTMKKTLLSMPSVAEENLTVEESSEQIKSGRKCWKNLTIKDKYKRLSLRKLIAIIRLALMINDDDIFLSDILRWIHEGHFHVNRVNLFLPDNVEHNIDLRRMAFISSRKRLNEDFISTLNDLKVDKLPSINLNKLITRFCDELQLPSDFKNFVYKLTQVFPPNVHVVIPLPDIEIKVMSYILFAAKFLFCLDGNAENLSSHFAEKVNKSNKVDEKLFSWNDYVEYIECRSSILSEYSYLIRSNLYGNRLCNAQLFLNDWNMKKSTIGTKSKSNDLKKNTDILLRSLPDVGSKGNLREIPASITPLSTTLKWIFEYHSMQLNVEAKKILQSDFTQTEIIYLTEEKRIHELAKKCDIPIVIDNNKPVHYAERKPTRNKDTMYVKRQYRNVEVYLRNDITKKEQENPSEDSYKLNLNTIVLGSGTNYWCLHYSQKFFNKSYEEKINAVLKKQLPNSFLWFMNQCIRILDCRVSDLYWELNRLERNLSKLLTSCNTDEHQTESEDTNSNVTS